MIGSSLYQAYSRIYSPDTFMDFYDALAQELCLRANPSRPIPFSPAPLVLDKSFEPLFVRVAELLWAVVADPFYRSLSAQNVPESLRAPWERRNPSSIVFDPGRNIGCIDLHLDRTALRLIEFMVLPPGCVGVYPRMLERYGSYLERLLPDHHPVCFRTGWNGHRCEEVFLDHLVGRTEPERIGVIDWEPESQSTYGEFCYILDILWRKRRIHGLIADPRDVMRKGERVLVRGLPTDRILNRVTLLDWRNHYREMEPYTRLLWESPELFVYHPYLWYLGDKASLTFLSDPECLACTRLGTTRTEEILALVPRTRSLSSFSRQRGAPIDVDQMIAFFGSPSSIVLKPHSSHASKGILFGPLHTPTREHLKRAVEGLDPTDYVAMELVAPPEIPVPRGGGQMETWHFDIRIFVLDGQYVFPGGRVYFGDYTNQIPCRSFAPLFFE